MVKVNGTEIDVAGKTVAEYLMFAGYDLNRVAVECNENIIPKNLYRETVLKNGDSLEVVSFVGGG